MREITSTGSPSCRCVVTENPRSVSFAAASSRSASIRERSIAKRGLGNELAGEQIRRRIVQHADKMDLAVPTPASGASIHRRPARLSGEPSNATRIFWYMATSRVANEPCGNDRERKRERNNREAFMEGPRGVCRPERGRPPFEHDGEQVDADRAAELPYEVDRRRRVRELGARERLHGADIQRGNQHAEADTADDQPERQQRRTRCCDPENASSRLDAANSASPATMIGAGCMRSVSRPPIAMANASAMPGGSSR